VVIIFIGLSSLFEPLDWGLTGFSILKDIATGRVGWGTAYDAATMLLPGSWSWADEAVDAGRAGMRVPTSNVLESVSREGDQIGESFLWKPRSADWSKFDSGIAEEFVLGFRDYEAAVLYGADGRLIAITSGGRPNNVGFGELWQRGYRGSAVHNHPRGTSFSLADLIAAKRYELSNLVAIGSHEIDDVIYRYSLGPVGGRWQHTEAELKEFYKVARLELLENFRASLPPGLSQEAKDRALDMYQRNYLQHDIFEMLRQDGIISYNRERVIQ
jgi:hypothetical protein